MAIVIEERKNGIGFLNLLIILIIIGIVFGGAYFLFFSPSPKVDVILPKPLEQTSKIAKFTLDPGTVFDGNEFKALRKVVNVPTGGSFGRGNPFLAP